MKLKRKVISILVTMSMLLVLLVPLATPALAGGDIDALTVPVVVDAEGQTLGTIKVTVDAGSIEDGDVIIFKITGGYDFATAFSTGYSDSTVTNGVYVPDYIDSDDTPNGLTDLEINVLDENDEVQITADADQSLTNDFVFYIYMRDVDVEEGTTDDNTVTFSGPTNTGFPKGTVVNATVESEGMVELAASGTDTSNDDFDFDLRLEESIAGSLKVNSESLKFKLPAGYEWDGSNEGEQLLTALWGDDIWIDIDVDDEELYIEFLGVALEADDDSDDEYEAEGTSQASAWDLTGLSFTVSDEDAVKTGDINAKVSGKTDADVSSLKVGKYGDFGATASAKDTPTVYAGFDEQEIGDIVITEDLGNTLVEGRTVTLTLPPNARWQQVYDYDLLINDSNNSNDPDEPDDMDNFDRDESLQLNFDGFTGTDKRTAKFKVDVPSSDAATIDLEEVEVALEAGVTGDLVVTVGGSAGLSGEIVVAKVEAPITGAAVTVPNVIIGLGGQTGAEFTITEAAAECFDKDGGTVTLDLPGGLLFTATPKVEVTAGDLRIGNVRRTGGDNQVSFTIESESTEPSTITVSGAVLKLDRTVAEGDVTLKVQGDAAVKTDAYSDWSNSDSAAKFAVAKVVTPAPGETKYTTVFTIGSTAYTVNGAAMTADVAPYIDANGRTMLPIRFAANAAGVTDANIFWNQADQSVILIKGDRIVKLVVGSTTMTINGVPFAMDTVPVIVDPGRVMLPIRAVAQALGCEVAWDAATQTVTITQTVTVQ